MSALTDFRALVEAPGGPQTPEELASALADAAKRTCAALKLAGADIEAWGPVVTMMLSKTSAWEAVAFGPDEFQFYPGIVKADGAIQWANVWVANLLPLGTLVDEVAARINAAAQGKAA